MVMESSKEMGCGQENTHSVVVYVFSSFTLHFYDKSRFDRFVGQ